MSKNRAAVFVLFDCLFLFLISVTIVYFLYSSGDVPGGADWSTHLSKIRFITDNLPILPRWYPEAGFGTPFLRFYPPLSYYLVVFNTRILGLNIFEGCKVYFIFILSIGSVSTYALARELGLKRIGCLASGLLLLGSYNIYVWWWIGQLPNMTAVMFTPLALLGFLRAIRKKTIPDILLAGLLYAPIFLSHLLNTVIFGVILLSTGVFMIFLRHELLFIAKGPRLPPQYTLIVPKVLFLSLIEAFALSAWWYLPFLSSLDFSSFFAQWSGYGVISAGESAKATALKFEFLLEPSLYYLGIGHLLLVFACVIFIVWNRKKVQKSYFLPLFWFFVSVFGAVSPYFGIPTGLPFRFGPYMALSASLMGGMVMAGVENSYRRLTRNKLLAFLLSALLLAGVLYEPIIQAKNNFSTIEAESPTPSVWLPSVMAKGERLGSGTTNWINVFSDIAQSAGADTWVNEFAYTFWYYIYHNYTPALVPYFASNFNVRYFLEPPQADTSYFRQINDSVYEFAGFNSSLIESTEGKILVLFLGDEIDYTRMFISTAPVNSSEILLVYGGRFLEDLKPEILRHFNIIYLSGLIYRDMPSFSSLLRHYVESGGGLILDTGLFEYEDKFTEIPEPFPVIRTAKKNSTYNFTAGEENKVTNDIDFEKFWRGSLSFNATCGVSYADEVRKGSSIILRDDDRPVMVYWSYGAGKVIWYGLRLPFYAMLHNNIEESRMLVKMIKYAASPVFIGKTKVAFDLGVDWASIKVAEASVNTGIWIKITHYPGWEAWSENKSLEILKAGPGMMLVFPEIIGNYELTLYFGKANFVKIGEVVAVLGLIVFISFLIKKRIALARMKND